MTLQSQQAIIPTMRKKQEVLDELRAARATFLAAIRELEEQDMLIPGVVGTWSVKDIMAHITAWESELVTLLNKAQGRSTPQLIDDVDEWNEKQYHANAARPLVAIIADFESVHAVLLDMVKGYSEEDLFDGQRYHWLEGEPLLFMIEDTAILHEQEHAEDILAWRDNRLASGDV